MGQVFDLALTHSQAWVLLAMADHADHLGERVWPSVPLVAWKTGMSPRQVKRIIAELRALGALEIVDAASGRPGEANHYRLNLDAVPRKPPFSHLSNLSSNRRKHLLAGLLAKGGPVCRHCQQPGTNDLAPDGRAWEVDRIVPGSAYGLYTEDNVVLSCGPCNKAKKDRNPQTGAMAAPVPAGETGAKSETERVPNRKETGAKSEGDGCQAGVTLIPIESSEEPSGGNRAKPHAPVQDPIEADDPEDLWEAPVQAAEAYTERESRLLAFAAKHGATLDHPSIGDLRGEWLAELSSPGLTLEEAEEAFRAAGHSCLPSHWRRHAPSAEERHERAQVAAQRKRDAEYLAAEERKKQEWLDHCAKVLALRAKATATA